VGKQSVTFVCGVEIRADFDVDKTVSPVAERCVVLAFESDAQSGG
jgi:hypothetical protein